MKNTIISLTLTIISTMLMCSCHTIDDDRIPAYAVNINLADAGIWNTYGVSGFGINKRFIYTSSSRVPSSFPYTQQSATGYGGVLLIGGMDPYTATADVPLAYDLSCPVEVKPDVRIEIDDDLYEAVCPKCGSRYDVTMGGGTPLSGPAASSGYGLRRYKCIASGSGGYLITN